MKYNSDLIQTCLYLLKKGSITTINNVDSKGWTVLHYAASFASIQLVKILLLCDAKVSIKNHLGYRPFEEAQARNRFDIVELLTTFIDPDPEYRKKLVFLDNYYGENGNDDDSLNDLEAEAEIDEADNY